MKRKLLFAIVALLCSIGSWAQTDVTTTYLTNANFATGTPIDNPVCTYGKDMAGNSTTYYGAQEIDNWTNASVGTTADKYDNCGLAGALFAYGGTPWLGGSGYTAPATDSNGDAGNAAGLCAVWGNRIQYTQAVTLAAGNYTIKFQVYNATTGNTSGKFITTNLFGFDADEGDDYYSPATTFAIGQWTTVAVSFSLASATSGKISMGYVGPGGSGDMPHLFVDNVKIFAHNDFTDCTDKVSTGNAQAEWTGASEYQSKSLSTRDGRWLGIPAKYGTSDVGDILYQTVTGLTNGIYEVAVYAMSQNEWNNNGASLTADAGDAVSVFAEGKYKLSTKINARRGPGYDSNGGPKIYTISDVEVDDGTMKIGLAIEKANQTEWHLIQIQSLVRTTVNLADLIAEYDAVMATAEAFSESTMFASDWSTLQTAISDNTLDTGSATQGELNTAIANLTAANAAATAAVAAKTTYNTAVSTIAGGTNVSLTSLIVNPSFESDLTGWTNVGGIVSQGNTSFSKTGSKYAEYWQPNGTKSVSQTIGALPAGIYTLQLRALARGVTSAKLFANSNEEAITIADSQNEYTLTFEIADKASINIGFEAVCTGAGSSWIAFDNFRLTYIGSVEDLTYTKATGKMDPAKSAAQDAAETAFLANKNLTNYNTLVAAIAEAETSVANYATLKTAIDKAVAVKIANNFVTAAATTAFQDEIDDATSGWTDVTFTDAEVVTEITTLATTVSGWHAIADEGAAGAYITSAWSKTHENWWDAPYINTWSIEGDEDGTGFSVPFFEWYVGNTENLPLNTTKSATLTGLENGCYEVEIWARVQRRTDADFGNNNEITMSVNGGEAVSIMNGEAIDGGYYDGTHTMRIGRFTARGMVTDGTLTLSIATGGSGSNVHWLSWRDITYTKLDAANMTITDAQYATFVAPFDVEIPAEVEAYTVETATGATLNLTPVATTIPANTPVVLYKETALAETPFYGKPVAGTPVAGLLTGVYSDTPAPNGSYVLQNNESKVGFYLVNTEFAKPTVGANRCYLDPAPAGVKANAFFFNEATGIQNVLENLQAGEIYDISGRKLGKLQKGVNIVNGKKVLVK